MTRALYGLFLPTTSSCFPLFCVPWKPSEKICPVMSQCLFQSKSTCCMLKKMPLACLCFYITIWEASQAQNIVVFQPSSAEGTEGGSVVLRCSYNVSSEPKVGSFRWVKDQELNVTEAAREFRGRTNRTSDQDFISKKKADLVIRELRHYDTGMYVCLVNIQDTHNMKESSGNGTELQVVKPKNASCSASNDVNCTNMLLTGLGVGLGSALAVSAGASLMFLYCAKKQGHQARAPRAEHPAQDHKTDTDLNYAEITAKKGGKRRVQSEAVIYAAVQG